MGTITQETEINAPVRKVFEYYTNPDNIKNSWPQDIVKESENVSGQKSEEGSEMKVKVIECLQSGYLKPIISECFFSCHILHIILLFRSFLPE